MMPKNMAMQVEDGRVTLTPEEAGLKSQEAGAPSCSLDGKGC